MRQSCRFFPLFLDFFGISCSWKVSFRLALGDVTIRRIATTQRESRVTLETFVTWGPPQGGARGPWPPRFYLRGPVMHLAPQILGKIMLCIFCILNKCTRTVFFLEKTMECIHNTVYFIKISKTSKFFLKTFKIIVNKIFEISSNF